MTDSPSAAGPVLPDAPRGNLVDSYAPAAWRPYLRLARIDRPIGWWLLLLPCWWSAAAAAGADGSGPPSILTLALFWIGAVAMRGAGSTYNDIIDRDLDRQVERTRNRPIPSGQVTARQAAWFLLAQCGVGLAVLLQFNRFAIATGFASLVFVLIYPFMKRITSWPQAVLGLAFAWGGLMGWAAHYGALGWPAVFLYAAAIAWTMGYDTVYAIQDLEDDVIAGIKSTARMFGAHAREAIGALYLFAIVFAAAAIRSAHLGVWAYIGLIAFATHLFWQVRVLRKADGAVALRLFRSNRDAGLLLFAGLALDAAVRTL
ncbi:4-hydroxybenzoate octaprenyltransferase [Alsobacter metallidurans]|uniref:4-hydroxybenzoate octaprenyltransferase n=1 Tax=Alsobacter metallidurans TaxID=340221 RepID=A0A917I5N4_9HYPH|nr:4-hydroxybenzoate octaprenyltransferase [Alsobacter metallidurans]GGH11898.1 4-hydroxybenzoate octaprenyltransferase [Alsobacter metallidurans]